MGELSIAIADDNPQTLGKLQDILESEEGFLVVGKADNGEDAYNMIVKTNPDVVLLDVIMPRMDGISVMEKVRGSNEIKKIPAFIMESPRTFRMKEGSPFGTNSAGTGK